jgi:5-oxoprolinase (ATP-hydrolysing) subunit A
MRVDLNADVGEGCAHDRTLMTLITSANIACGWHAGDASTMRDTVALALSAGVALGAHPSYPDRDNFGRVPIPLEPADVHAQVIYQVGALAAIARSQGGRLSHVKPHGALYNQAANDALLADAIAAAVRAVDPDLALFGLAGGALVAAASRAGLTAVSEVFADRAYQADGSLVARGRPGALVENLDDIRRRTLAFVRDSAAIAVDGSRIKVRAQTICLHGDTPNADAIARCIRETLDTAGVSVRAP